MTFNFGKKNVGRMLYFLPGQFQNQAAARTSWSRSSAVLGGLEPWPMRGQSSEKTIGLLSCLGCSQTKYIKIKQSWYYLEFMPVLVFMIIYVSQCLPLKPAGIHSIFSQRRLPICLEDLCATCTGNEIH